MIEVWDDLPLHQTPALLSTPASDDPRAYERYWFGFASEDGAVMAGLVVGVHPNLGRIDAAFSVSDGERAETLFAVDELRHGRQDLVAGPVRLTLEDPMRGLRIRVDGDGFAADLTFRATTPAITEDRVTRTRGDRVVQDRIRYVQLGTLAGRISSPLGSWTATHDTWRAGRDHSWGIRDAPDGPDATPGPSSPPASGARGPSFFWLIGTFDDRAVQAVTHAEPDGRRYGEYAATVPPSPPVPTRPDPVPGSRPCPSTGST